MLFRLVHFVSLIASSKNMTAETNFKKHPKSKNIVRNSLGGIVALELQKQHPNLQARTY